MQNRTEQILACEPACECKYDDENVNLYLFNVPHYMFLTVSVPMSIKNYLLSK